MANRRHRRHGISLTGSRITSIVSVTLVLLLLSIVAVISMASRRVIDAIHSETGFTIIVSENATQQGINSLKRHLTTAPYVASYIYSSPEDVLAQWEKMSDAEENEALAIAGVNPFLPEFDVKVKAAYASADSLLAITTTLESLPQVESAKAHTQIVSEINTTIKNIEMVLLAVAIALLVISFVLINNTVRLAIYSRRFLIHTMKLVGAKNSFIRRPFLTDSIATGAFAGVLAAGCLAGLVAYSHSIDTSTRQFLSWGDFGLITAGTVIAGMLICVLAALFATNRHLKQGYGDLFRY